MFVLVRAVTEEKVGIKKVELRNWSVVTEFSSIPGFPI
jgi:hypothetical protein